MKNYDKSVEINCSPQSNFTLYSRPSLNELIIASSGQGKTKVLLKLIKHQWLDVDKIY